MQLTPNEIRLLEFIRKSPDNMQMVEQILEEKERRPPAGTSEASTNNAANGHAAHHYGSTVGGTMQEEDVMSNENSLMAQAMADIAIDLIENGQCTPDEVLRYLRAMAYAKERGIDLELIDPDIPPLADR